MAAWLHERRPASQLELMQHAVPALCSKPQVPAAAPLAPAKNNEDIALAGAPRPHTQENPAHKDNGESPASQQAITIASTTQERQQPEQELPPETPLPLAASKQPCRHVVFGRQLIGKTEGAPVHVTLGRLSWHSVIMAGSGAGKTVLVRHLVEEAALQGIPSIVIDCANDLATLGDQWPTPPTAWDGEQKTKAESYFQSVETIVWTPGLAAGNPLQLAPLPDLAAVADDPDELQAAVSMVVATLGPVVAPGKAMKAKHKRGVLFNALKYFAQQGGGSLQQLEELLGDLPPTAGLGLPDESKLAAEMAASLCVEMAMNPLLGGAGEGLDPLVLFGDVPGQTKTRISVINFTGLPDVESQRSFLNQLAMTLFAWIKRNPKPPGGRPLRGLLVLDEAKDFIPSVKGAICKDSFMQLTAQARKYGLGIVFATQNPCEIESKIVGNCSVKCFGKANGPQAIKVIQQQLHNHGVAGNDVAKLAKGNFYLCGARDNTAPAKIHVPLCLSHHRSSLVKEEVLERAVVSRQQACSSNEPLAPHPEGILDSTLASAPALTH